MRYVVRDALGDIVSVHRDAVAHAEALPVNHPELMAFMERQDQRAFAQMDAGLVRVLEDLIDVLMRRNVLSITDLPAEAQAKLLERKHFREGMQAHALELFGRAPQGHDDPATGQARDPWSDVMP